MATSVIAALSAEPVLESNALATLTSNWVVVPHATGHARTMVALSRLKDVRIVKFSHPGLLVLAAALFLLSAAASYSHQGAGAAVFMALIGLFFVAAYLGSRRAAVALTTSSGSEVTQTVEGPPAQAAELVRAIQAAREKCFEG